MPRPAERPDAVSEGAVMTKAVLRAAGRLGVSNKALAGIIGLSEASVSRMGAGDLYAVLRATKPSTSRCCSSASSGRSTRSFDGDEAVARAWLRNENAALGGEPLTLIQSFPALSTQSRTWTPDALSSERRRLSGPCWRAVEAQHRVSTLKIVDTLAEQGLLETLLERTKPPVPSECRHLHYLLATPFGTAHLSIGIAISPRRLYPRRVLRIHHGATAVAEVAFHRLLFFADSPETPWPSIAGEYTVSRLSSDDRGA